MVTNHGSDYYSMFPCVKNSWATQVRLMYISGKKMSSCRKIWGYRSGLSLVYCLASGRPRFPELRKYYGGALYVVPGSIQNPRWSQKTCIPLYLHTIFWSWLLCSRVVLNSVRPSGGGPSWKLIIVYSGQWGVNPVGTRLYHPLRTCKDSLVFVFRPQESLHFRPECILIRTNDGL